MDYRKALASLERLLSLVERSAELSPEEHAQIPMLYGACEPVVTQIVGVQKVSVPVHGNVMSTYPNFIEASATGEETGGIFFVK